MDMVEAVADDVTTPTKTEAEATGVDVVEADSDAESTGVIDASGEGHGEKLEDGETGAGESDVTDGSPRLIWADPNRLALALAKEPTGAKFCDSLVGEALAPISISDEDEAASGFLV